jgi:tetratricopeptide (TPR) repeat protein
MGILFIAIFALSIIGCGKKAMKEESVLDTPENHFSRGMIEFERGNLTSAMAEFQRAKALNPNYAEAFSGMALVYAKQGDFKKAYELADDGIGKNDKSVDVHIMKGRVITMERKGDDWIEDAAKSFNRAIKINPNSSKAWYYLGITYKEGFVFGKSVDAFRKVVELKGEFSEEANNEWELVQKIERAKPGTKVGAKIALIPKIDRADLSVLLMEELKLMTLIQKKRPEVYDTRFRAPDDPTKLQATEVTKMEAATDIKGHWAENWVKEIINAQLPGLEPYPDHTFQPDKPIDRANYAQVMQGIMILVASDEGLATKYVGEQSRFPDVSGSHFAYNAMALMVDRGIMKADKISGSFKPKDPMSGADALLAIRDFQNALRITF